ncbi:MAG TPA: peptide-methionine (R)-S-oxide reductase, partial [Verrucomicrobiae bacterium]|nr:peptide-methionine (R)-S-oxide reductase [Verrucomicrobiae bacterium]
MIANRVLIAIAAVTGIAALGAAVFLTRPSEAQTVAVEAAGTNSVDMKNFQKPPAAELKKQLTPLQYDVTQEAATEPAFHNTYWDNHKPGIYVDIVSG